MILQRYKFLLIETAQGGAVTEVHPVYKELNIEDTKDAQNMFFKKTINGEVTFKGKDYEYIKSKPPSTIFYMNIVDTQTHTDYLQCSFRYVDMNIDNNKQSIKVGLSIRDGYDKITTNLETEYDLIKIRPELSEAEYTVSNCLQMTTAYSQTNTNVYRRNIVTKSSTLGGDDDLFDNVFSPWYTVSNFWIDELTAQGLSVIGKSTLYGHFDPPSRQNYDEKITFYDNSQVYPEGVVPPNYTIYRKHHYYSKFSVERGGKVCEYQIRLDMQFIPEHTISTYSMSILAFETGSTPITHQYVIAGDPLGYPWRGQDCSIPSLASGVLSNPTVKAVYHPSGDINMGPGSFYYNYIYARLLSRTQSEGSRRIKDTDSDIYSEFYNWVKAYPVTGGFKFSLRFSLEPTEYGVAYREGTGNDAKIYYYTTPDDESEYEPFIRDEWDRGWSLWIDKSYIFEMFQSDSNIVTNNNFVEVGAAIKALLREIDPDIQFDTTKDYSQFLYGDTFGPFKLTSSHPTGRVKNARILLTQKSNTTKPNPDYFAMKAPITLGSVLDLLREAFNVYWFIDEEKRFRLEHIRWFMKNGNYGDEEVSLDLSQYFDKFNNKSLAYYTDKYTYDLSKEYTKRKLSWQEETTDKFTKSDIKMLDTYDDTNKTQEGNINLFTPDIEYCAIFGKDLSKDGFTVVMALKNGKNSYSVPLVDGAINGDMDMLSLFRKWLGYGLPTKQYTINKDGTFTSQIPSYTHKNSVSIPGSIPLDNLYTVVMTEVGKGHITKMSRNLDTDYVTLELMYERQ